MNSQLTNITDLDIQALVDGELDWEDEKQVRQTIKCNSAFLKRYSELSKQKKLIQNWFNSQQSTNH